MKRNQYQQYPVLLKGREHPITEESCLYDPALRDLAKEYNGEK